MEKKVDVKCWVLMTLASKRRTIGSGRRPFAGTYASRKEI